MHKILIIDDEPAIRMFVSRALRKEGFEVIEADDGLAGVKLARTQQPSLILSDVRMTQVDGYTAVTILRLHPSTANIPCILMTGDADLQGMRHGMSLGADDYLPKPFNAETLLAAVRLHLKKRQAIEENTERKLAELRGNISTMLPHELLTPLNGILGLADLVIDDSSALPPEELVELVKGMRQCGRRLEHLIKNFINYTQIEVLAADGAKLAALRQTASADLGEAVEARARQAAATWKRDADLILELAPASVAITEDHLHTILTELMDNAFKFSTPGTLVRAVVTPRDLDVLLAIQDQGRGMRPDDVSNLGAFNQFERRQYEQQGVGLGLIISRRLAEIYGGRLEIKSVPAKGTIVELILPLVGVSAPPPPTP
jgi:two-component system sensor histidine kinase/response regulator